jgi:hypothetical protein
MAGDGRDLVRLLKDELRFVELGGYDPSQRGVGQPRSIFRDSLTCINFGFETRRRPCRNCHLFRFVDLDHRTEKTPCHFISLTEAGETIAALQSANRTSRLKTVVKRWLRWKISELELECLACGPDHREQRSLVEHYEAVSGNRYPRTPGSKEVG